MEKKISKALLGEIFEQAYTSGINIRFEWWDETGFTWSIVSLANNQQPRIMIDDEAAAGNVLISKSIDDYDVHISPPVFVEPDWICRGNNENIEVALYEIVEAMRRLYPNSEVVQWLNGVLKVNNKSANFRYL